MTETSELPLLLDNHDPFESYTSHIASGRFSGLEKPGTPCPPRSRGLGSQSALASTSLAAPNWVPLSRASFPTLETRCQRPRGCRIPSSERLDSTKAVQRRLTLTRTCSLGQPSARSFPYPLSRRPRTIDLQGKRGTRPGSQLSMIHTDSVSAPTAALQGSRPYFHQSALSILCMRKWCSWMLVLQREPGRSAGSKKSTQNKKNKTSVR